MLARISVMVPDFSSHSCFPQDVNLILSLSQSLLIIVTAHQKQVILIVTVNYIYLVKLDMTAVWDENLDQNAIHFHFLLLFLS